MSSTFRSANRGTSSPEENIKQIPSVFRTRQLQDETNQTGIEGSSKSTPSVFRSKKPKVQESEIRGELRTEKDFPFEGENDLEREIERSSARGLSRGVERIAGLPGDILGLVSGFFGNEPSLPTSGKLKELSEKATGGYTKPQSRFEESTDEFVGDIASMMTPGARSYSVLRNIGIPLLGTSAKELMKGKGVEEKNATWAKSALMLGLDLITHREGGSKKYIGDLFQAAEEAIPTGTKFPVSKLKNSLNSLKNVLERGGTSSRTSKALTKVDEALSRIKNGEIDPKELPAFRRTVNAAIDDLGGWDNLTSPKNRAQAIRHLNQVKSEFIDAGKEYGISNPQFLKAWESANEASAVASKSNVISNAIEKVVGQKAGKAIRTLFGLGGSGAFLNPASALIAGGATGGYQAVKLLYRVFNSPTLAKYYSNVISAASKEQGPAILANVKALEKKLKEEDEKDKEKIERLIRRA